MTFSLWPQRPPRRARSPVSLAITLFVTGRASSIAAQPGLPPEEGETHLRALTVPGGLTSDEVARRAVTASPDIQGRLAGAEAASAREDQAKAELWPRLSLSARYTRLSPIDPPMFPGGGRFPVFLNNYAVNGSLSVPVSDYLLRLSRSTRAAARSVAAAKLDAEATRRKVAADARLVYYDWIRARGQLLVLEQRAETARTQVHDVERLFQEGVVSRADLLAAQSQLKSVELAQVRARQIESLSAARLRVLMHDGEEAKYQIGEDVLAALPPVPDLEKVDALMDEARGQRPELSALREIEAAAQEAVKLAGIARWPRLDLVGNVAYANPNQRIFPPRQQWDTTWDAGVLLSYVPTDRPGANAREREQLARVRELGAQRAALIDGLRLEVQEATNAVRAATAALETAQQGVVAAQEGYRVRRELFRAGRATLLEVTSAETELMQARLELVNAHVEARQARVRLARSVGRDGSRG